MISLVIGSFGSGEMIESCLEALESQADEAEVIVCEAAPSAQDLRERFLWAKFVTVDGGLVPHLWAEGIRQASGDVVALTISAMIPASDWLETVRRRHEEFDVIAGAIEPGTRLRVSDWAEYFCRYSRDMLPFQPHECAELPGDNSSYKRELLSGVSELFSNGFWEPEVNRGLSDQGVKLWHLPDLVVYQGRSAGFSAFARQRFVHGRNHGRQRGARFTNIRNLAGTVGSPLVPVILTARVANEVLRRKRCWLRLAIALPLIFLFNLIWGAGEALGHIDALKSNG